METSHIRQRQRLSRYFYGRGGGLASTSTTLRQTPLESLIVFSSSLLILISSFSFTWNSKRSSSDQGNPVALRPGLSPANVYKSFILITFTTQCTSLTTMRLTNLLVEIVWPRASIYEVNIIPHRFECIWISGYKSCQIHGQKSMSTWIGSSCSRNAGIGESRSAAPHLDPIHLRRYVVGLVLRWRLAQPSWSCRAFSTYCSCCDWHIRYRCGVPFHCREPAWDTGCHLRRSIFHV